MKNISTILSILALLLIGTLFYLHFTHVEELKKVSVAAEKNAHTNFKIAYFDIDSLQEHYEYYKDVSNEMKKKESSMNAQLNDIQLQYQRTVRKWQGKGNNITPQEGETAQQELGQINQKYQETKTRLEQDLQRQQVDHLTELRQQVEDYLKVYNKTKGYAYILSYEPGIIMFYKDSTYNITNDLITGLNAQYKEKKKQ